MRTPPLSYQQTDDDLQYLADLNNEHPDVPTLPSGGAKTTVNEQLGVPPPTYTTQWPDEQPAPDEPSETTEEPESAQEGAEESGTPAADVTPAPVETPTPAAPPASVAQPAPWHAALAPKAAPQLQAQELASTSGNESKLVSKAPQWYDFEAPPEYTGNEAAIMNIVAGLIQAGVAKDKKTAIAMALGGVADAATSKLAAPMQDYQNRLKAANTQAGMAATLGSRNGSALGAANLDLAERKFKNQLDKEAEEKRIKIARDHLDSPETKALQDAVIKNGTFDEQTARSLTGNQIVFGRVGGQQLAGFNRSAGQDLTKFNRSQTAKGEWHGIERADKAEDRALDRGEKLEDRDLDKQKDVEQAYIPGRKWLKGRPPPVQQVGDARTVAVAGNNAVAIARHLSELQEKVSNPLVQAGGVGWNNAFGNVDQAQLLADMNSERGELEAAIRILRGQGAPQPWELAANAATNPEADSVFTFFKGKTSWDSLARQLERTTDRKLRYFGSVPDEGDAANAPVPPSGAREAPQKIDTKKAIQDSVGGTSNKVKQVAELIDTAKQAAQPAVDSGKKLIGRVKYPNGVSSWMPMTEGLFKKLQAKYGDDNVVVQSKGQVNAR